MFVRPYQSQLKADIYQAWNTGNQNVLAVLPTGGGKTWTFSEIIKENRGPAVAIAHRQEIVTQISLSLAKHQVRHRIIGPANVVKLVNRIHIEELGKSWYHPQAPVAVAGVDTLTRRDNLRTWADSVTLWVQDECFTAGTLVDGVPIEKLKIGDVVTSFDETTGSFEKKKVSHIFKNPLPEYMVRVTVGHHVINTTSNHPFYTKRGWVEAGSLTKNDELYLLRESGEKPERPSNLPFKEVRQDILLQELRVEVPNSQPQAQGPATTTETDLHSMRGSRPGVHTESDDSAVCICGSGVLRGKMLAGIPPEAVLRNDGENEYEVRIGENEEKQPYEPGERQGEDVKHASEHRAPSERTRGEWDGTDRSGKGAIRYDWPPRVCSPTCDQNRGRQWVPSGVQARPGALGFEDSRGGGRIEPQREGKTSPGPKERKVPEWVGVDSTEVFKSTDTYRPNNGGEENYVYNLEVEDFHTYLVEGVVVHNCHHNQHKNKWGAAAQMFPNARGLGVTATPCRADGRGLGFDNDGLYHTLVQGPGMRDLINQGYLSDYRIFCPTSQFDWSSMKIGSDGDYTLPSAKAALSKSTIVGDVVASYLRFAPGKLGITFATDLETAALIAEQFRAAGVAAELISSNTSDADRVAILRRFRRRETMQLVNVDLVGEGFDVPGVEVVSMARPTKSFALFAQQFGRALRPVEGKVAIIIDHVGNIVDIYTGSVNHGLPDAPRVHTLDRRERRERDKDPSIIPIKACPNCASTYERIYRVCPWCGYEPQPLSRSGPEFVDGDLTELDAVTLARLRGEAVDMNMTVPEYLAKSGAGALGHIIATAAGRRFERKQKAQNDLRASMAQWAGYQKAMGRPDSESYRLFYFLFGTDVLSAQALGQRDAENLKLRIDNVVSTL